jgi:tetratricopeptide (TPR) repeat protein
MMIAADDQEGPMSVAYAEALFETGNHHDAAGAFAAAAIAFDECAELVPGNAVVLGNLATALVKAGRMADAIPAYRRCLAVMPDDVDRWFGLANALRAAGPLPEAVEAYVQCLRRAPEFGPAYVNLASALRELGLLDQALIMAAAAVRLMPGDVDALTCIAGLHYDCGAFATAVSWYGQALALAPGHAGVLSSLANALQGAGRLDAALVLHDRAYAAAPDHADYRYNRALSLLAAGDFSRGWVEHEWRFRRARAPAGAIDRGAAWAGEPLAGKTIVLHAEQGFGDTIQFVRYAPLVAALGATVVLEVPGVLTRLMGSVAGVAQVFASGVPWPRYDWHCSLMSLPLRFATEVATIPAAVPYVTADSADCARFRNLHGHDRPLVGLVWAGGAHHGDMDSYLIDRRRSVPVEALAPLAATDLVQFVSLQKDFAIRPNIAMSDPMPWVEDFADTAAVIAGLDLVIAVDTAVAHLAGAMGKTVWLLSRYDGCWRWGDRQCETPWYPKMRIFRQDRPADWDGVIAMVAKALTLWSTAFNSGVRAGRV